MASAKTHIIKRDTGWAVKKQGTAKASKVYKSQEEAIRGARRMSTSSEIVVHRRDGSIRSWIKNR